MLRHSCLCVCVCVAYPFIVCLSVCIVSPLQPLVDRFPELKAEVKNALQFVGWLLTQAERCGVVTPADDSSGVMARLVGEAPFVDMVAMLQSPAVRTYVAAELGVPEEGLEIISAPPGSAEAESDRGKNARVYQPSISTTYTA